MHVGLWIPGYQSLSYGRLLTWFRCIAANLMPQDDSTIGTYPLLTQNGQWHVKQFHQYQWRRCAHRAKVSRLVIVIVTPFHVLTTWQYRCNLFICIIAWYVSVFLISLLSILKVFMRSWSPVYLWTNDYFWSDSEFCMAPKPDERNSIIHCTAYCYGLLCYCTTGKSICPWWLQSKLVI